jgi:hypothetical protein
VVRRSWIATARVTLKFFRRLAVKNPLGLIFARSAGGSFGDALNQLDCCPLSSSVLYKAERFHETKRVFSFQPPKYGAAVNRLTVTVGEKEGQGNLKDFCNLLQATCANSLRASFILLHLLKTYPKRLSHFGLG